MSVNNFFKNFVKNQVKLIFENDLLLEADYKKKILSKFPIPESTAEYISYRLGKLSLWFLNALEKEDFDSKEEFIQYVNQRPYWIRTNYDGAITKILDWLRHPLMTGTRVELRDLTLREALLKSDEFHDQLESIGGTIDYDEKNEKIVQYDNGFYWIKIPSNYSDEECKRMGHCGRTNKGDTLFSLRSSEPFKNNHTINRSYITVAYNSEDGIIYQSKSFKNKKPETQFFPYFYDLIMRLPYFEGLGKEYQKDEDIDYEDFTDEQLKSIYQKFPNAFKSYNNQKLLFQKGIIDKLEAKPNITLNLNVNQIDDYINIDRDLRKDIIKKILVEPYDLYDYYDNNNWEYSVDNIDSGNKTQILNYISKKFPDIDISSDNLKDIIEDNKDELDEIITAINRGTGDCERDDYENYCYKQLKKSLEFWGEVSELSSDGAIIEVNIENFFSEIDKEHLDDAFDRCNNDKQCAFEELIYDGSIDKPDFYLDDRYTPYCNSQNFNAYLSDALAEIF